MRYLALVFLSLTLSLGALAQGGNDDLRSARFILPDTTADNNSEICIPVTTEFFTGGFKFGFALQWEPTSAASFVRVQAFNPKLTDAVPFNAGNFNTDDVASGLLSVFWQNQAPGQSCEDVRGVDLARGETMFEVCFFVSGPPATNIALNFFNKPDTDPDPTVDNSVTVEFDKFSQCGTDTEVFPSIKNGSIVIDRRPLILDVVADEGIFRPGDTYCVDLTARSGFDDLLGLQYSLAFDTTVLRVTSVDANQELPGHTNSAYVFRDGTVLNSTWNAPGDNAATLDDGTRLVTICFDIVGDCASATFVGIGLDVEDASAGPPTEATGGGTLVLDIPVVEGQTRLNVDNCVDGGFQVIVDCPAEPVGFRSNICIPILAGNNFVDMTDIDYLIKWDPNVLRYTGYQNDLPAADIRNADFDDDLADRGTLAFDWNISDRNAVTLAAGETFFEVCFEVIGFSGTSPILVTTNRNEIENLDGFINAGIDPRNCSVTVAQEDGVNLTFPTDYGIREGEETCFSVTVAGFRNVTEINSFLVLPSAGVLTNFSSPIPGLTLTGIEGGLAQLSFTYDATASPEGVSLPDGDVLLEVCLTGEAGITPGECNDIDLFSGAQIKKLVQGEEQTLEPSSSAGQGCVLFPNGFGLSVSDATNFIDSVVCVPVSVNNFDEITSATVDFTFDRTNLTFDRIEFAGTWPGLDAADFNLDQASTGIIKLDWSDNSGVDINMGLAEPSLVFELCFRTNFNPGCSDLVPRDGADPAATVEGEDGSIVYESGEVCVEDRIVLNEVSVIPASCSDTDDAVLLFDIAPRADNEDLFIRTRNPIRIGTDGRVGDLLPGTQVFTIYNARGTAVLTDSVFIGVNPDNLATADAGGNVTLDCTSNRAVLNGRTNVGTTYRLLLELADGNTRLYADGDITGGNFTQLVDEAGRYFLEVRSAQGCPDRDTVVVSPAANPTVVVTPENDGMITCDQSCILLSGEGSAEEDGVRYAWWSVTPGGERVELLGTERDQTVCNGGRYRLIVDFPALQCSDSTQVNVTASDDVPGTELLPQYELPCDGSAITLSTGPFDADLTYRFVDLATGQPLGSTNEITVSSPVDIEVTISDAGTSCSRTDTVVVTAAQGAPGIDLGGRTFSVGCDPDTVTIDPAYTNTTESTRYRWRASDGARVVITDTDSPVARVVAPGTITLIASNGECADSITFTVGDPILPTVDAGETRTLSCTEPLTLNGSATTATGNALNFRWTSDGQNVPAGAAATVSVSAPGVYRLEATDAVTGCSAVDSVVVLPADGFPEYELADTTGGLGCAPSSVELDITVGEGVDYGYRWTDPDGEEISTQRAATATTAGVYTVEITNRATGCTATDSTRVIADADEVPFVTFRRGNIDITCESGRALIDASGSSSGPEFAYEFSVISGGETLNDPTNDTLFVNTAGTYRLTIMNTETNCSNFRDVFVTDSRQLPQLDVDEAPQLDCDTRQTTLSFTILDQPNDYTIRWVGPGGLSDLPTDTTRIAATEPGTYIAVVVDPQTSCSEQATFTVVDLVDSIATLNILPADTFDCSRQTITLDASDSDIRDGNSTIRWMSLDGNRVNPDSGSLIVAVDGAGDYELAVTDASGCTVRDTVSVVAGGGTPFATVEQGLTIMCGETISLSSAGSSEGAGFFYSWTVVDGAGNIVSGADTPFPLIDAPGTYQLVVANGDDMCSDTARTVVELEGLDAADLGSDFTTCDPVASLTGNQPPGTSGTFSLVSTDGGSLDVTDNEATVTVGNGTVIAYTLSAPGCPDYSSDTVRISPEEAPIANDDVLELTDGELLGTVNVLDNDIRTGPVTVTLLTQPAFGEITVNLNGDITFEGVLGLTDVTTVDYEVCSNVCEGLCDRATLTISTNADGTDPTVYNVFTPNGDGRNDCFVFDILNLRGGDFPNNELIVFNRWGDVIYEAAPYNNDWKGTSNDGGELPEGTYYYILRLDVGEGEIIRGDVTILR